MLVLGATCQTVAQALRVWPIPPFGLYVFSFWLTSLGQAFQDTHANTFVASRKSDSASSHRWLAFIHALYMAGCLAGPFCASSIASSSSPNPPWYLFYTIPLGLGVINLTLALIAFRETIRRIPRQATQTTEIGASTSAEARTTASTRTGAQEGTAEAKRAGDLIKDSLKQRSVWLLSLFFFFYLGVTVTAGGWVVEYLVDVRNGNLAQMGYVPAGFSGGCLLGRILLPEPTHRWGERRMVFLYCLFCLAFQLVFWL